MMLASATRKTVQLPHEGEASGERRSTRSMRLRADGHRGRRGAARSRHGRRHDERPRLRNRDALGIPRRTGAVAGNAGRTGFMPGRLRRSIGAVLAADRECGGAQEMRCQVRREGRERRKQGLQGDRVGCDERGETSQWSVEPHSIDQ
jgi:hypothetical protein